jgi:hypothetical protein
MNLLSKGRPKKTVPHAARRSMQANVTTSVVAQKLMSPYASSFISWSRISRCQSRYERYGYRKLTINPKTLMSDHEPPK